MSKIALLSVYHKEGIVEFAKELVQMGWAVMASSGTSKVLQEAGIAVKDVATIVGKPILGHRVVTLSREVHAGLLATEKAEDQKELDEAGIARIDLVCVDLYPLRAAIREANASEGDGDESQEKNVEAVIEKTDIGGPTMLRAAAKGGRIVICDPHDRAKVLQQLREQEKHETIDAALRKSLAAKAEAIVSEYVLDSARYHGQGEYEGVVGRRVLECKYGENAWQTPAALYASSIDGSDNSDPLALDKFTLLAGTSPSYNNFCDLDRMLQTITHIAAGFEKNLKHIPHIAVGVKHGNPCGAAVDADPITALQKMLTGSKRAIFGGLVITNFPIGTEEAETLLSYGTENKRIFDGLVAPEFTSEVPDLLERKGGKCRLLVNPELARLSMTSIDTSTRLRMVRGGFLAQPNYTFVLDLKAESVEIVNPRAEGIADVVLAWAVGSTSNSNTISIVKNQMLIGNGVGQQDRVGAAELAIARARSEEHDLTGAVAYSDSFFPFVDGPKTLADAGINTIIATSGSVRDNDVKALAIERNLSLYVIPDSEARGFFGH